MTTGTTVGTSTDYWALPMSPQRAGVYYVQGRYWAFFFDGTNVVWTHSTDLSSWAAKQTAFTPSSDTAYGIAFDGTYFHFTYASSYSIYYVRGTPVGDGSMTLGAARSVADGSTNHCYNPAIAVSSDNHAVIEYKRLTGSTFTLNLERNDGTTSVDTWIAASGYPVTVDSGAANQRFTIAPMNNASIITVYMYASGDGKLLAKTCTSSGTVSGAETAVTDNDAAFNQYAISVDGLTTHLTYVQVTTHNLNYCSRSSAGVWSATTTLQGVEQGTTPYVFADPVSHNVWAFWTSHPTADHVYYDKCTGGSWGGVVDWLNEGADHITATANINGGFLSANNYLFLEYVTKTSGTWNVKIASLALTIAPVAAFSGTPLSGPVGTNVTFTDASTNTPTSWDWDFGDGSDHSTDQNPTHQYTTAGTYTVVLTATNSAGSDDETKTGYIYIYPDAVVWASNTAKNSDDPTAWDVGAAPDVGTVITLSAAHTGKCTINQAIAFGTLTVPANAGALEIAASCSVPNLSNAADIVIDSTKVLTVLRQGANTYVNTGTIRGPGTLSLLHKDASLTTGLGKVTCPILFDLDATAGASYVASLGSAGLFGPITVQSSHASNTLTLDLKGLALRALGNVLASTRGLIRSTVAGASLDANGNVTVAANGSLILTNFVALLIGGNFDPSAGTLTQATSPVLLYKGASTGISTIKLGAGQKIHDLVTEDIVPKLSANAEIQGYFAHLNPLIKGAYTLTLDDPTKEITTIRAALFKARKKTRYLGCFCMPLEEIEGVLMYG